MVCAVCSSASTSSNCQFSLDTALDNIRKHYKTIEAALEQKAKENKELKEHNNKLVKAVECLKKPKTLALLHSFSEQAGRPENDGIENSVPSLIFDDITIIDDEDEDSATTSVMDTALNGSALNSTATNEVITETEHPEHPAKHPRRLGLKLRSKKAAAHKSKDNEENTKPTNSSSRPMLEDNAAEGAKSQHQKDWGTKLNAPERANKGHGLSLRQTRLVFDEKRERNPNGGTLTRTKTLGKIKKKQESKIESDDDIFNLNSTPPFQFKSPTAKKPKFNDSNAYFACAKPEDSSLIVMPSPTQTVCFLDDTSDVEVERNKSLSKDENYNDDSTDSLADFEIPEAALKRSFKPSAEKLKAATRQLIPPVHKVKEDLVTQEMNPKPVNPVFQDSDTAEESDDEFIVRPMQIKVEPEQKNGIDIDSITCKDCRNYIKFCGERMTAEKLEEHIRNCVHHSKPDELRGETPEGFWNPFLLSFSTDDPRNEVLIDNRFADKNTTVSRGNRKS